MSLVTDTPRVSLDQSCEPVPAAVRTGEGQGDRGACPEARPPRVRLETQPDGSVRAPVCVHVCWCGECLCVCCMWVHISVCWWVHACACSPRRGSLTRDRGQGGAAGEWACFSPKL